MARRGNDLAGRPGHETDQESSSPSPSRTYHDRHGHHRSLDLQMAATRSALRRCFATAERNLRRRARMQSVKSATGEASEGFTDEERARNEGARPRGEGGRAPRLARGQGGRGKQAARLPPRRRARARSTSPEETARLLRATPEAPMTVPAQPPEHLSLDERPGCDIGALLIVVAAVALAGRSVHWHPRRTGRDRQRQQSRSLQDRAVGHDSLWIAWVGRAL